MPELESPYYWTSGNTAEVEFVVQYHDEIIPIEVKAERNLGGRSLSVYTDRYTPAHRIRFSTKNLQQDGNLLNIPSPLAGWLPKFLSLMNQ